MTARSTLFVFGHYAAAKDAGFRPDGGHRLDPELYAVWPAAFERLRGREFARVFITEHASRSAYERRGGVSFDRFSHTMHYLRSQLRLAPKTWIDL